MEKHTSYQDPFPPFIPILLGKNLPLCLPNVNAIDGFPAVSYTELTHPSLDLGLARRRGMPLFSVGKHLGYEVWLRHCDPP